MNLATTTAKSDTAPGEFFAIKEVLMSDAGSNNTWRITFDAENQKITIDQVDSAGALVSGANQIELDLNEMEAGEGLLLKIRETMGCDANGDPAYCYMLRSAWYSTPYGSDFT